MLFRSGIADIEVPVAIDRDIGGAVELGAGGGPVVAGESAETGACAGSVTCIGADDARLVYLADDVVIAVREVHVARIVHSQTGKAAGG